MKREEFVARAVKDAEKKLGVPAGWWGSYRDVRGPQGQRVLFSAGAWTVQINGKRISRHDSRSFAIMKAGRLLRQAPYVRRVSMKAGRLLPTRG